MDEKCRHGLKGFKFPGLQKLLRKLGVTQAGGDLVGHTLEKIEILLQERRSTDPVAHCDDPENLTGVDDRHGDTAASLMELIRMPLPEQRGPTFPGCVDVNRLGVTAQRAD